MCKNQTNLLVVYKEKFLSRYPVSNEQYGDPGKHCFMLPWFNEFFPYNMNSYFPIIRTKSYKVCKWIRNQYSIRGYSRFLNSLERPLENEDECVHFFLGKTCDVDIFVYTKLQQIPSEKIYKSNDKGSEYNLNRFYVSKNLGLRLAVQLW